MALNQRHCDAAHDRAGAPTCDRPSVHIDSPRLTHLDQSAQLNARAKTSEGLTLLHRTTRKLTLSDAGRDFFERSSRALEPLRDAQADLHDADGALTGTIRMSAPGAFGRRVLAPALVPSLSEHPGVCVDLRVFDTLLDLIAEGIDLAIRAGGSTNSQHFAVRSLCRCPNGSTPVNPTSRNTAWPPH
ncbi:MAG: DNA-binding transcriptional LysR family regulator [Cognaticolwellia sp.]|jgi:DNA-binding transcriptional LysR family regulator